MIEEKIMIQSPSVYIRSWVLCMIFLIVVTNICIAECIPCKPMPVEGASEIYAEYAKLNSSIIYGSSTLVYFFVPGCFKCKKTDILLINIQKDYPDLEIIKENMSSKEVFKLRGYYDSFYGVPYDMAGVAPAIFIANTAIVGNNNIKRKLEKTIIENNKSIGSEKESITINRDIDGDIVNKYLSFKIFGVVLAGLIDGVNPCAFTTLIFFISYMLLSGKSKKQVLCIGMFFIFGVFVTYFLIGTGIINIFHKINKIRLIPIIIYPLFALISIIFAVYNVFDAIKAKKGDTSNMILRLPNYVHRVSHYIIRKQGGIKVTLIAVIFVGVLISILEFGCTGQIYLPTIVYVMGIEKFKAKALVDILIYNIMFIIPLVAIFFAVSIFGVKIGKIRENVKNKLYLVKYVTAFVFLFLSAIMVYFSTFLIKIS